MTEDFNKELEDSVAGNMLFNFTKDMILQDEGNRKIIEAMQRYGLSEKQAIYYFMK